MIWVNKIGGLVMSFIALVFVAVGLAMDAFTVSIAKGISLKKATMPQATKVALFFGGFQALMPLLGWLFGLSFEQYIKAFDHWIALILLTLIGGKMLYESFKGEDEEEDEVDPLNTRSLVVLAIATSIDALAVGVTFAFLDVNIIPSIALIGIITFFITFAGVIIGNKVGEYLKNYAEIVGGIILILIGISIFLEHTVLA